LKVNRRLLLLPSSLAWLFWLHLLRAAFLRLCNEIRCIAQVDDHRAQLQLDHLPRLLLHDRNRWINRCRCRSSAVARPKLPLRTRLGVMVWHWCVIILLALELHPIVATCRFALGRVVRVVRVVVDGGAWIEFDATPRAASLVGVRVDLLVATTTIHVVPLCLLWLCRSFG